MPAGEIAVAMIVSASVGMIGGMGIFHLFEGNRRLGWLLIGFTVLFSAIAGGIELLEMYGVID
jgi:hypothetical protein